MSLCILSESPRRPGTLPEQSFEQVLVEVGRGNKPVKLIVETAAAELQSQCADAGVVHRFDERSDKSAVFCHLVRLSKKHQVVFLKLADNEINSGLVMRLDVLE